MQFRPLIDVDPGDQIYQHISKSCDVFREVRNYTAPDLANLIYKDGIDILIDLAGYTTHSRPEVIALRPAPIQISYMGYLESMGPGIVDYAITDVNVYPENGQNFWHEQAIRLPHHVLPYDNQIDNASQDMRRSDYGLPEDGFIFCCLNNSYKIEPEIFAVWMNILSAVPGSVLWLLDKQEQTRVNLQNEAQLRGIDVDRLIFAPIIDMASHCKRYQLADLFLDTLWCGGHTTALEALWQGLPLLTCEGKVVSARLGTSCLRVLDLPELITRTTDEYERKAIYYAQHPAELKALREKLETVRHTSPLFNTALHVKHLEAAYEMVWQRYKAGLPPAQIDVPELDASVLDITNTRNKAMH
jgi:predicted O-linked N-acetylglucosamine transferase (SPINDLY family)